VYQTYADVSKLATAVSFKPATDLKQGMQDFVKWYQHDIA
jgi:UDP-glucuronate 4-epimerase